MHKVFFKTSDDIQIMGNNFPVDKLKYKEPVGWIVFLHMMPATKESWTEFSLELQNLGYESLAIDLRGHGESTEVESGIVERLDFTKFTNEEHQKSIIDIEAAIDYLKTKGATPDKISLIGASIGANLALQYISNHPEFKTCVLLSPGLDYRGIKTEQPAKELQSGQKAFFISSKDDNGNSIETKRIFDNIPSGVKKELQIFNTGGHGTNILNNHPELKEVIINFINKN